MNGSIESVNGLKKKASVSVIHSPGPITKTEQDTD
jgi:hypothetical protein